MAVFGNDAAFLQQDARQHNVLTDYEVAPEQGIQSFDFD
jgi:hypothetical protein